MNVGMKTVTINNLGPGTLTVTVRMGMRLKVRIQLALVCIRIAGWLLDKQVAIEEKTNTERKA